MFSALVSDGEQVRLPSGRVGTVIGRGEDRRVIVRYNGDNEPEYNTVEIYAKHVQRVGGPLVTVDGEPVLGD